MHLLLEIVLLGCHHNNVNELFFKLLGSLKKNKTVIGILLQGHQVFQFIHLLSVAQSCLTLCNLMNYSPPSSSVHGTSRQEYWSGLHFLLLGIFLTWGSNLCLLRLLHWQVGFFFFLTTEPPGKPKLISIV